MMATLPEGWVEAKFGSVCEYGKAAKSTISDVNSGTWILELEDIEKETSKLISRIIVAERPFKSTKNVFKKGDVLYGKLRPYLNKVIFADAEGVCTTEIIPIDAEPFCCNKYIFYWLKNAAFLTYVTEVSYGVNMPRLGTADGQNAPFVLAPLAEQKIIAEKLDSLLTQVNSIKTHLDKIPQTLKHFRQAVLSAAVTGKLTEEWRTNGNYEPWVTKRLSYLCSSISDGDHQAPPKSTSGIPFLVISDISCGFINLKKTSRCVPDDYYCSLKSVRKPRKGDILYTVTGSFGIPVIVDSDDPFCFQRHIAIIKPDHTRVDMSYLYYFLQSPVALSRAELVATGTAQKTVSLTSLRQFDVATPPLEEQKEIVARVEKLFTWADNIEKQVAEAQKRVNNLTQSILAKAFRGELTEQWRQDHPDLISGENSAVALLEKIKAERALQTKKGKKKA